MGIWKIPIFMSNKNEIDKIISPCLSLFYTFPFCCDCITTENIHWLPWNISFPWMVNNNLSDCLEYLVLILYQYHNNQSIAIKNLFQLADAWQILLFTQLGFFVIHIIICCKTFSMLTFDYISWCNLMYKSNQKNVFH